MDSCILYECNQTPYDAKVQYNKEIGDLHLNLIYVFVNEISECLWCKIMYASFHFQLITRSKFSCLDVKIKQLSKI